MIEPKELLPLGFCFVDGIPEALMYYLDDGDFPNVITYAEGDFSLGIGGCRGYNWTHLNIDSINDVILTIELLQDGDSIC